MSQFPISEKKFLEKEKEVLHNIECDSCSINPIKGNRYESQKLKDFNLCEKCYGTRDEELGMGKHPFNCYKISTKRKKTLHLKITCDKCHMNPITGLRYKCLTKENYDLCEKCFPNRADFNMLFHNYSVYKEDGVESGEKVFPPWKTKPKVIKHEKIQCNECKKFPIEGKRYQCVNCFDYDLCESCFPKRDLFGMLWSYNYYEYLIPEIINKKINGPSIPFPTPVLKRDPTPGIVRMGFGGGTVPSNIPVKESHSNDPPKINRVVRK